LITSIEESKFVELNEDKSKLRRRDNPALPELTV